MVLIKPSPRSHKRIKIIQAAPLAISNLIGQILQSNAWSRLSGSLTKFSPTIISLRESWCVRLAKTALILASVNRRRFNNLNELGIFTAECGSNSHDRSGRRHAM
jgi:hypothetical protein